MGAAEYISATLEVLRDYASVKVSLFGNHKQINPYLKSSRHQLPVERVHVIHSDQVVEMHDKPGLALRNKQASSMWKALELVATGQADACVSAGNTGALMAMSCHLVKSFDKIQRPAICKPMPTRLGASYLLDLGANIRCSADQLIQFAHMGASLAYSNGRVNPTVALLNVGIEANKGGKEIQQAAEVLEADDRINYVGFVEGDLIYSGDVDVIVCDGFAGNVALKVSEGVAKFAAQSIREELNHSIIRRMLSIPLGWLIKSWWQKYNPALYNGAVLLGLKKIVVKSHGSADKQGFYKAIETAIELVDANILGRIEFALGR